MGALGLGFRLGPGICSGKGGGRVSDQDLRFRSLAPNTALIFGKSYSFP